VSVDAFECVVCSLSSCFADLYSGGGCDKAPDGTLILKKDRTLQEAIPRCLKGSMDQDEAVGIIIGNIYAGVAA